MLVFFLFVPVIASRFFCALVNIYSKVERLLFILAVSFATVHKGMS